MATHIKVLAWIQIALSALMLALALLVFFGIAVGGLFSGSLRMFALLSFAGGVAGFALLLLALPGLVAGWGLLQRRPWARVLTIILAVLHILNFPFGTLFAAYALWVLLSRDGAAAFRREAY